MFTTNMHNKDYFNYISNDDLFLAYKNNAILTVKTNEDETSIGYTTDDFDNSDIICMSYDLYCNMPQKKIKDVLVVWIDNNEMHRNTILVNYTKEFLALTANRHVLYFSSKDLDDYIITYMMKYIAGNKEERKKIEEECN